MSSKTILSDQDKAIKNLDKLSNWIKKTKVSEVPRNQFGKSNRAKIMSKLEIRGSKDQTAVKKCFSELDDAIKELNIRKRKNRTTDNNNNNDNDEIKFLRQRIAELEKSLALVSSELERYKKHDTFVEHLIKTGTIFK